MAQAATADAAVGNGHKTALGGLIRMRMGKACRVVALLVAARTVKSLFLIIVDCPKGRFFDGILVHRLTLL